MATTFTKIASVNVTVNVASMSFTSIPSTYTDLLITYSARDTWPGATANDNAIQFNGSGSSFTGKRILGNGSAASSDSPAPYAGSSTSAASTTNTFCNNQIYIPNYTSSNYKSYSIDSVTENNATEAYQILYAGLWSQTAAITSVTIVSPGIYYFGPNSTATLYGIKNS
jgi:hypothetical protein